MTDADKAYLQSASYEEILNLYAAFWNASPSEEDVREMILADRYFLLTQICNGAHALHPWIYARCREVEAAPDEHLDLWSRGHYKSTIITFAGGLQDVLAYPEKSTCILSYKKDAAAAFVSQIRAQLEGNDILLKCFPDILYPERSNHQGDVWSNEKLCVKRTTARKEATLQCSGLVSGMLTGGHFDKLVYDDTVTPESVTTPEQIERTTDAWRMSLNLGTGDTRHWYIGTRYAMFDTYYHMLETKVITERRRICHNENGKPVLLSQKEYDNKRATLDSKTWASQMLQSPVGEGELMFNVEHLQYYQDLPKGLNNYLFVDTALEQNKSSDYTAMAIIGLGRDKRYYLVDLIRDKLKLSERMDALFYLNERYNPILTFYEKNANRSEGEIIRSEMNLRGYRFPLIEMNQTGNKKDRISNLEPLFRAGRIILPERILYRQKWNGQMRDLIRDFIEHEYAAYPSVPHDDILDCLANITLAEISQQLMFPKAVQERSKLSKYSVGSIYAD
jgi:predicted phage terminase large subunit-like protein